MEEEVDVTTVEEWIEGEQLTNHTQLGVKLEQLANHTQLKAEVDNQHEVTLSQEQQESSQLASQQDNLSHKRLETVQLTADSQNTDSQSRDSRNELNTHTSIMESIQNACAQLLRANQEYLFLVGVRSDSEFQGLHFSSPRGHSFLESLTPRDLMQEFVTHCQGRQSGVPGSEVTTEPDKDKVVDKVFTEVKDKSSEVKVELSDQREENHRSQKKQTTARRQTKKEPETETSQKNAEEDIGGLDDFCEDDDDDDHGGDDDDWRPSEEEEAKVSKDDDTKEPRAKKNKMADVDYESDDTITNSPVSLSAVVSNICDKLLENDATNQSTEPKTTAVPSTVIGGKPRKSGRTNQSAGKKTAKGRKGRKKRGPQKKATVTTTKESQSEGGQKPARCGGCKIEFINAAKLRLHHKLFPECLKKNFSCDLCPAKFVGKYSLLKHERRTHTVDKELKRKDRLELGRRHVCVLCNEDFETKSELLNHQQKHYKERFVCRRCKKVFTEPGEYEEHRKTHEQEGETEDTETTCINCEREIVGSESIDASIMLCEECCSNDFTCKECQQKYKMFYFLAMHDCRKSYSKNMEEILAVDFDNLKTALQCKICDKKFKNKKNLCAHYKTHNSDTCYQCNICWRYYKDSSKLRKHKRYVHSEQRKFECSHCGLKFKEKNTLVRHGRICDLTREQLPEVRRSKEGQVMKGEKRTTQEVLCQKCWKTFATERIYLKHVCEGKESDEESDDGEVKMDEDVDDDDSGEESSDSTTQLCRNCGEKTNNKKPLCKRCGRNKFVCSRCHQAFTMLYVLALHSCEKAFKDNLKFIKEIDFNKPDVQLVCQQCNKSFKNKKNLCSHYKTHMNNAIIQCDICQQTFKHQNSLHKHKRYVHTASRDFICDICGKAFKQSDTLNTHRRLHIQGKTKDYQCEVCGKYLSGSTALSVHMNIHSGAMPFICEICGRSFRQFGNLQKHKVIHGNIREFSCHLCPDKSFRHSETYKIHMKGHVLDGTVTENKYGKIYSCQYCQKQMPSASQYTVHLRTHTNERPFECKICSKAFKEHGKLKRHMNTHSQETRPRHKQGQSQGKTTQNYQEAGYQPKQAGYQSKDAGYQPSSESNTILETIAVFPPDVHGPLTQAVAIPVTDNTISFASQQIPHFTEQGGVISIENSDKFYRERYLPLE